MTEQEASTARRVASTVLCALVAVGLVLLVAQRVWQLPEPTGHGLPVTVALALAAQLAAAGALLVLLVGTRRTGLPAVALAALAVAALSCGLFLGLGALEDQAVLYDGGYISFGDGDSAFQSRLDLIIFPPELQPGTGAVVVGTLGLLPWLGCWRCCRDAPR